MENVFNPELIYMQIELNQFKFKNVVFSLVLC